MINEHLQNQIEQYVEGNLSGKDLASFEQQLQSDAALAKEVELYRDLDDLMGESDVIDFRNTLSEVMEESRDASEKQAAIIRPINTQRRSLRRILALAAGFALIALATTVLFFNNQNVISPESLYAANMDFPTAIGVQGTVRSIDNTDPQISDKLKQLNLAWQEANTAYQNGDYSSALNALQRIPQIDPNFEQEVRGDYYFNKGLMELKLEQYAQAIASFEAVTDGDYIPNAEWKRALALLKTDPQQAKIALKAIADSKHPERVQAAEILEKLD